MKFTQQQIENWQAYEAIRVLGDYNMIADGLAAASEAGLDMVDYRFVRKNYTELRLAYEAGLKSGCPHCGSTKGSWFSRVVPMGNFCVGCGKSID